MKTIFEKSVRARRGIYPGPVKDHTLKKIDPALLRKTDNTLPEVSELDVVRHFTALSQLNFSVDTHFYPLGSCTMKYNPKINETVSSLPGFQNIHPFLAYVDKKCVQGSLEIIHDISELLCEITGMNKVTTQPYAGAHGELTGILLMAAYHRKNRNNRKYIIVPESAHGTNPASAVMGGYEVVSIPSGNDGTMDFALFTEKINDETAGVMLTLPNTLGLFIDNIKDIIDIAHKHDALVYMDGANLNALLGRVRPGDLGFDLLHMNLHKTFSTPHGGGGPGAGAVGVSEKLADFVPVPAVIKNRDGSFSLSFSIKDTIGPVASFWGNFSVIVRAYAYICMLGREGLIDVSEKAVLNANYILKKLNKYYHLPFDRTCMHECVFTAKKQLKNGVHAIDIAKALIDRGIHPPTIYFPLVVEEAIMIEPTETESKETLDEFIDAMIEIAVLAENYPDEILDSPAKTSVSRPDETKAARELKLIWQK